MPFDVYWFEQSTDSNDFTMKSILYLSPGKRSKTRQQLAAERNAAEEKIKKLELPDPWHKKVNYVLDPSTIRTKPLAHKGNLCTRSKYYRD